MASWCRGTVMAIWLHLRRLSTLLLKSWDCWWEFDRVSGQVQRILDACRCPKCFFYRPPTGGNNYKTARESRKLKKVGSWVPKIYTVIHFRPIIENSKKCDIMVSCGWETCASCKNYLEPVLICTQLMPIIPSVLLVVFASDALDYAIQIAWLCNTGFLGCAYRACSFLLDSGLFLPISWSPYLHLPWNFEEIFLTMCWTFHELWPFL